VRDRTVTEQVFDQRTQAFGAATASVAANEAALRQAELDLEFTELRAPVAGRIGDRRVSPGNLVTGGLAGNTSMLATIVSLDPIRFEFTFDEASYLRYERFSRSGKEVTGREGGVIVGLKLLDEKDFVHRGTMDFVDNVIDKSSGTIRGRAVFSNPDRGADAWHVRTHPRAGLADLQCLAVAGCARSAPSRSANSCWWSATTTPRCRNTSRSDR
jgi:RND family efflux transporter MFP subunit